MTGFGRGSAAAGALRVTVELRAVNHRFLEVKLRGAAGPAIEEQVTAAVRERVSRGALTAAVVIDRGPAGAVAIDRAAAVAAHRTLATLAYELGMAPPTMADVLAVPGVLAAGGPAGDDFAPLVAQATAAALDELTAHRAREGQALVADVAARVAAVRELHGAIATAAAAAGPAIAARVTERIERLAPGVVSPERLAQELALLVERADVTEELVRAAAHLEALAATLAEGGPIGRRLDFLLQELGREINTTGAKSPTAAISALVVQAKAELEKMREQVQNLE